MLGHAHADVTGPLPLAPTTVSIKAGGHETLSLGNLQADRTYTLTVTLESGRLQAEERLTVELLGTGDDRLVKELHAGDPDVYVHYRPLRDGQATLALARKRVPVIRP